MPDERAVTQPWNDAERTARLAPVAPLRRPTRAHTRVVRTSGIHKPANRRLEAGLTRPITSRRAFVAARAASLAVAGLIALVALDRTAHAMAITLVVAAAVQWPIAQFAPRRAVSECQALADLAAIAVVLTIDPTLWSPAMLWIGAGISLQALVSPHRISLGLSAVSVAAVGVLGRRGGVDDWFFEVSTAALLTAVFTVYGRTLRREIWENESAMLDALTAAGAVVHHSDLDEHTVIRIEGEISDVVGWTTEEWCATDLRTFLHPDDVEAFWIDEQTITPNTVVDRLGRVRKKDGGWAWMRDVALVTVDSRGHRTMRGFSLDVTEVEAANERVAQQLRQDSLTGLPNRLALIERINELLDGDTDFALMISDLDRFKEVNDTLGHEAGDQLLQMIAIRLAAAVRPNDLVARLGGDEYAVVVVGPLHDTTVVALAQRLAAECARPVVLNGVDVAVATSTGIALRSRSGESRATMLRHADIAMYEAKRSSESLRVFDESLEQTSTLRLTLSASLTDAIESGELTLFFQPKYDIATRRLVGAEGLARWRHPEFGLLTPAAFLDVALMSETAMPFALSTIRQVAAMIRELADLGHPLPIAGNVAMRALRDPAFAPAVLAILDEYQVSPDQLVLELTESDPLWPNSHTLEGLRSLIDAGVRLSIDDFGTGHSSLERLCALRIHELKIDRSFVDAMTTEPLQHQIVRTIIDLADGLDYQLVAEGVETEEQAAQLLELGCATGQGYLFAKPMPATEFVALARAEALADAVMGS